MVTATASETEVYHRSSNDENGPSKESYKNVTVEKYQETTSRNEWREENMQERYADNEVEQRYQEYHYDGSPVERTRDDDDRIVTSREGRRRYSTYETVPSDYQERRKASMRDRALSLDRSRGSVHFDRSFRSDNDPELSNSGRHVTLREPNSDLQSNSSAQKEERSTHSQQSVSQSSANSSHEQKEVMTEEQKTTAARKGFYLTHLNLTSADVRRRMKEKEFVQEAIEGMKRRKEAEKVEKMAQKKKDMDMLKNYNPWGKPGAGAPRGLDVSNNKEKLAENLSRYELNEDDDHRNILTFGKPGYGAPLRSNSGRKVTQLKADPKIRFQENEKVRKTVENQLRYRTDPENKKAYHEDLDRIVKYKELSKQESSRTVGHQGSKRGLVTPGWQRNPPSIKRNVYPDDPEGFNYNPWGKGIGHPLRDERGNVMRHKCAQSKDHGVIEFSPSKPHEEKVVVIDDMQRGGAGAPIKSDDGSVKTQLPVTLDGRAAVKELNLNGNDNDYEGKQYEQPYAGKKFIEKLGWSTSGQPHRRSYQAKKEYLDALQNEMVEKQEKLREEQNYMKNPGLELATLMKGSVIGKPKRDPYSGEILDHHKVVKRDGYYSNRQDSDRKNGSKQYHDQLTEQAHQKVSMQNAVKTDDRRKSIEHINSWNELWGKPGHGAPVKVENHHKELPPTNVPSAFAKEYMQNIVKSTHVDRYELDSKKQIVGQKDYKFRIPYAAVDSD